MLATFIASGINYQIIVTLPGRREAERVLEEIIAEKPSGSSWRTSKKQGPKDRSKMRHYDGPEGVRR